MNNSTRTQEIQVLSDLNRKGEERPWKVHKVANSILSDHYLAVNKSKAARLADCSSWLIFTRHEGRFKLRRANFCRVRLCPMCNWRRSLKVSGQLHKIVDALSSTENYAYLMLTLTVRNVGGYELSQTIDSMMQGVRKLMQYKAVTSAVEGWFRSMEVTHNLDPLSASFDTYHPHFHVLLAVKPSYFKGKNYLSRAAWQGLWKKAMRLDYDPDVHVKRTHGSTAAAIAEAAKYAVKSEDYIIPDDYDLTIETIRILDSALHNRRFVGMGGVIREMHKKLHLDDPEDGDLTLKEDADQDVPEDQEIVYVWNIGYSQYLRD